MANINEKVVFGANVPRDVNVNVDISAVSRSRKYRKMKAERKRQMDLLRITEMRSREGNDPLDMFPKEIWMIIFDVLDAETKWNVWQVHPLFQDLLKSKQVEDIWFPLLLKVDALVDCVKNTEEGVDFEVQRLRLVSKKVRNYIDSSTDDRLMNFVKTAEVCSSDLFSKSLRLSRRDDRRLLNKMLTDFKNDKNEQPLKRFCARTLSIWFSDAELLVEDEENIHELFNEFKMNLISLLKYIGDQIWILRFTFFSIDLVAESYSMVYILLQQLVSLTPNVKWLEINIDGFETKKLLDFVANESTSTVCMFPFPTLVSLQRLTFHSSVGDIHKVVIRKNQHVKILDLNDEYDDDYNGNLPYLIQSLPLTSWRPCENGCSVLTDKQFKNIQSIINFKWKLHTINLSLDNTHSVTSFSLASIFKFLESFPTLETVLLKQLRGFKFQTDTECVQYLKLPNLKALELVLVEPNVILEEHICFFFSLQFLLPCEKIETLKWEIQRIKHYDKLRLYLTNYENSNRPDFRAGLRHLHQSNIWDVFPHLNYVQVYITVMRMACGFCPPICKDEYHRKRLVVEIANNNIQ